MIAIGNNKLKKRYITDSNGNEQEVKKVYIGTNLVHLHMQDSNNPFAYRITNDGKIGEAVSVKGEISNVKGNTISWNQNISNGNFDGSITNWAAYQDTKISVAYGSNSIIATALQNGSGYSFGIIQRIRAASVANHKYLILFCIKTSVQTMIGAEYVNTNTTQSFVDANVWSKLSFIITTTSSGYAFIIKPTNPLSVGDTYEVKNVSMFDLTLIYGAGNEPTTAEQFEADYERWFGKPLTYEAYNAGELISAKTTAIKTIGFNQWDEEWEVGTIDSANGEKLNISPYADNKIRSVNYIKVFPNTTYFVNNSSFMYWEYDCNKKYIKDAGGVSINGLFTTSKNCCFIRFRVTGTTYNHDVCINLVWSGTRNGEYEPYESHTLQLPITTLTGKLNGEGESVVVFPDGIKKAGSVQDEIYVSGGKTYAVKRIGSVDMGSLDWEVSQIPAGYFRFSAPISNMYHKSYIPNILSAYGFYGSSNPITPAYAEKGMAYYSGNIYTYVAAYTTIESFKAAMQGVMLYYELAEPLVYELDDFELPKNYIANGLGTEELLPANDTALVTAPADMTIDYTLN